MTSKEKLKELRNKLQPSVINGDNIKETLKDDLLIDAIEKDLEDYEELLKIMGTPIEKIMKKLKVLEILKKCENESGTKDYHFDYYTFLVARNSEDYKLIEDWWWLENGKD